jgi:hypothetical protein
MSREKVRKRVRDEFSSPGFVGRYLAWMRAENPEGAETLEADIVETFTTDEGVRVLIMLEKAVLLSSLPDGSDDRALREKNAVANFVLEIRRIVAHGGR